MTRLRLIFLLSLIVLAGIFASIIFFVPSGENYTESKRIQIIEGENEWILQCDIINNDDVPIEYIIQVTVDDVSYSESVLINPDKTYTYIHHVYPYQLSEGKITLNLYERGKTEPLEQATYYLVVD